MIGQTDMNIKHITFLMAAVVMLTMPSHVPAKSDVNLQSERYIIKFKANSKNSVINALANSQGKIKLTSDKHRMIAVNLPAQAAKQFKSRNDVEFVELDPKRYLLAEEVPYGIGMVEAVHDNQHPFMMGSANTNMTVCIMDTGYDLGHEDLPNHIGVTGSDGYASYNSGNWFEDGHGHGTHVSGTIAALGNNGKGVVGVNPNDNLKLHMVKVFNSQGAWAYGSDLVVAIDQCMAAGANVISMSLGGSGSSAAENNAFQAAYNAGLLSIAAAGNDGNSGLSYPASYDSVVSVAAVDSSGNKASFSQYNSQVEIAAPGVAVKSTLPNNSYASWNGTSMATPHVAGVAALVWNYFPECSNHQMRIGMALSAEDRGGVGRDNSYGYGIVKAKAMYDLFDTSAGCDVGDFPPPPEPTQLVNGEALSNLSGVSGDELMYQLNIPSGATDLIFSISGGSGDADLYVKFGAIPSVTSYDCRPYRNGNNESCSFSTPQTGIYYVMLRGYSSFSGVTLATGFDTLIPNESPSSEFSYECTNLSCTFDGSGSGDSDGNITSYSWNFGDIDSGSNSASGMNVSHTFSADGDYTVTLTVVDDGSASASSSQTFNVVDLTPNQPPTASFTASCTDLGCDFDADSSNDSDGSIATYSWNFGDGNGGSGKTSSNTYAAAGGYQVILTVTDNDGDTASSSQTVTVSEPEQPIDDDITLTLSGTSVKRTKYVDLIWANITGSEVDIYRVKKRKTKTITIANDGAYQDSFNGGGTYIYKVCQAGSTTICSADKTIIF